VYIFARPYTSGSPTPGYSAHPSPLYVTGEGTGSGWFTISSGSVVVDQIYIKMVNSTQTSVLFESYIPVSYQFSTHSVSNIVFSPASPAYFTNDHHLNFTFDYSTDESSGVLIWGRPFTEGNLTPNYAAHGSPVYPSGSGSGDGNFTITSGDVEVDQVRFKMAKSDQTATYVEFFTPSVFHFGNVSITGISDQKSFIPLEVTLDQNYPNPFNPETIIRYTLSSEGQAALVVFDLQGRKIRSLLSASQSEGQHEVRWDGKNDKGGLVATGIYIYQLKSKNQVLTKRMVLIR
jgi:hypothetical protein